MNKRMKQLLAKLDKVDSLSDEEIASLESELMALFDDIKSDDETVDDKLEALREVADAVEVVREKAGERIDAAQAEADAIAEIESSIVSADDESSDENDEISAEADDSDEDESSDEPDEVTAETTEDADESTDENVDEPEPVLASPQRPDLRAFARQTPAQPAPESRVPDAPVAELRGPGGEVVSSLDRADEILVETWHNSGVPSPGTNQRIPVLRARRKFDQNPERVLRRGDNSGNREKLEALVAGAHENETWDDAMVAAGAFCAPAEPDYSQPVLGQTVRPFRDGLPNVGMERGTIAVTAGPVLSDILIDQAAAAITTVTDGGGETKTVQAFTTCPSSPTETALDGIVFRLRFDNFQSMTWRERQEANVTLARVAAARHKEQLLLNKMDAICTWFSSAQALGLARDLLVAIDQLAEQERSRLREPNMRFRVVLPTDVISMVRSDITRQMPGDGLGALAVTEAQIRSWLGERGVNVTFTPDRQVYAAQPGTVGGPVGANVLLDYVGVVVNLFPEGTFVFGGGQELNLGIVRDSTLNADNEFEIFEEEFETLFRVGGWPAYRMTVPVCINGAVGASVDINCIGS